jgi:hypothetical protein
MIFQLHPSIPVVTPQGNAQAMIVIDYGPEHDLIWVCFLDSNGQCWSYKNSEIRGQKNITMGRFDVETR